MLETITNVFKNYGIGGLALVGVTGLGYLFFKLEKRVLKTENRGTEMNNLCSVRKEYFTKTFDRLDSLEKKDVETDGRFDVIDSKLDALTIGVNKIVDHFVSEGMKK